MNPLGFLFPWSCGAGVSPLYCMESALGLSLLELWAYVARWGPGSL